MASILNRTMENMNYLFDDLADPRTKDWLMMSGPGPVSILTFSYLYFCKSLGPRVMKNRNPFELKRIVMLYNVSQVLISLFLFLEGVQIMSHDFNFLCEPVDNTNSPKALRVAAVSWWYFIAKMVELLDTIFFVLRKKLNQVSFLHIYHHSLMLCGIWFGVKYYPGGHPVLMGTLNSFVHIIMYTYYFIAGLGSEYQKYIWWKKYVTDLQLIQFVIIFCHNLYPLVTDCDYPKILNAFLAFNACLFVYLFGRFYIENYLKDSKTIIKGKLTSSGMDNGTNNAAKYEASDEAANGKTKIH